MNAYILAVILGAVVFLQAPAYAHEGEAHETMPKAKPMMMMSGQSGHQASGLLMPMMNAARGRTLFASKGCVACHSVNGVGGKDAPPFDAADMPAYMNPFDFAARMWRGAATMIELQEELLDQQIEFTGAELADIIAFVHDADEQHKFSLADVPPRIRKLMNHTHGKGEHHHGKDDHHEDEEHHKGEDHHD